MTGETLIQIEDQLVDDLIIGIDTVNYTSSFSNYSVVLLSDEQGQYVLVQDRFLADGDDGTDILRRVDQLIFNGQSFGINPAQPYNNYLFSPYNQVNLDNIWIDLDGNVALGDPYSGSTFTDPYGNPVGPYPGQQGNQLGDDLIIGFSSVNYNSYFNNYAVVLRSDEQGQYVLVQDRFLADGDDGTDILRRVDQLVFNGQSFGINPAQPYSYNYLFSPYNQVNLDNIWIDLDGNVALGDPYSGSTFTDPYGNPVGPYPGQQGNQLGDDLIIGFSSVNYNSYFNNYAVVLRSDEQGQYVLVQDRFLADGDDGTDILRRVDQLVFNGQSFGINPAQPYNNYLFSPYNQVNLDNIWIDLDGNVALGDPYSGSTFTDPYGNPVGPYPGQQGNQLGDDLIIGFSSVNYNSYFNNYAVVLRSDEQGQYVLVQDRFLADGDDGTDILRRVDQLVFNGQSFGINPAQPYSYNYLFSPSNQTNLDNIWIDLDGNVALSDPYSGSTFTDPYGNPVGPYPGAQGNQLGDDLIIGFSSVNYNSSFSNYAVVLRSDEQGQYVLVQDRFLADGDDGTDILRRVDQLVFNGQSFGINPAQPYSYNYLFSPSNQANLDNIWIDLDGNVALGDPYSGSTFTDPYGNPVGPYPGQQGNQLGDDLIIGFSSVNYNSYFNNYAVVLRSDEQGQYVLVQDRFLADGDDGTDILRRVDQLVFNGQSFGINPAQPYSYNYLFSPYNQVNLDNIWIDLDGNVALGDPYSGSTFTDPYGNPVGPYPGQQGNQLGDDLIIGFSSVNYNSYFNNYAVVLRSDEQGQYVLVQDRFLADGDDGTDILRRVDQLVFNGQSFGINPAQPYSYNYLFSPSNQANLDNIWIDLDGNVALSDPYSGSTFTDPYGNPVGPYPGAQGNQLGDDLIIGFDFVLFNGLFSDYSITTHVDAYGEYALISDNNILDGDDGVDIVYSQGEIRFADASLFLNIRGINYAPTIFSESLVSAGENFAGAFYLAGAYDPDEDSSLSWTISGLDEALFAIDSATGSLSFKTSPNYEAPADHNFDNVYEISLVANDGILNSTPLPLAISVTNVNDSPAGAVTISGTPTEGQTLTASNSISDDDALGTISYQWFAGGNAISNATGTTLLLTQSLVGQSISVTASYTDGQGTPETVTSESTEAVINIDDVATGTLDITGTAAEGSSLIASLTSVSDPDGSTSIAFQWQELINSTWTDLSGNGANTATLSIPADQSFVGKEVRVVATTTDALGGTTSFVSTSQTIVNVNDSPAGAVTISGTPTEGQTLTASNSISDDDALGTISYQWFAGGNAISNATGTTLLLTQSLVGQSISVTASYTDGQGTPETVTSESTEAVINIDDVATGTLDITGTAAEGSSLIASLTSVSDPDGSTSIAFQWQELINSTWTDLSGNGANTATLSIPADQSFVGKEVRVVATTTDALGGTTSFVSTSQTIVNVNDSPAGAVTISGTPTEGQTLTASNSISDDDALGTISYQWFAGGNAISNATGTTLLLTQSLVGQSISVTASYTDGQGTPETVTSESTEAVINIDDVATGTLDITGTAAEGSSLIASLTSVSDPDGSTSIAFQWQELINSTWTDLSGNGANTATLSIPADQSFVGKEVRVVATTTDALGGTTSFVSTSQTIVNVNDSPAGAVTISGTPTEGQTLTASNSISDDDALGTISYQWFAGGNAISNATGTTLLLTQSLVGQSISVTASYTDGQGTPETVTSAATAVVAPAGDRTPPTLSAISLNGSSVTLTFSEALTTSGLPATSAFVVQTVSATNTVSRLTVRSVLIDSTDPTGRRLILTLGSTPPSNLDLRVSYTDPISNQLSGVLQDSSGNDVASFSNQYATVFFSTSSVTTLSGQYRDLTLTDSSSINGTGNANNNTITGNSAANSINGGAGIDTLIGGSGNDIYVVDTTTDTIRELATGGTDTVQSTVSFSLAAIAQVENLTLTGTAFIDGTGNTLANILTGNTAANKLIGDDGNDTLIGGTGNDTLTGGLGNDSFRFTTTANATTNRDLITDFTTGSDKLSFSKSVYAGFGNASTSITSSQFRSGANFTTATTTTQRFIYNTTTGSLYFDRDGSGSSYAPIELALLGSSTPLSFSDFVLTA